MAVTATQIVNQPALKVWDVEATADADAAVQIAHGFGVAPAIVWLVPLAAEARISDWVLGTVDVTNINANATTTAGGGAAGDQLRIIAMLPHSIIG